MMMGGRVGWMMCAVVAAGAVCFGQLEGQQDLPACSQVHVSHPVVSPDGRQVAFLSDESGSYELYLLELDSRAITRLTHNDAFEGSVSWSPDSREFVFWAWFEGDEDFEGYRYDVSARAYEPLIRHAGNDFDLNWSPDGRRVVFQSERDGNREIYVLRLEDQRVRRLTSNTGEDLTPAWSPDGKRIAFSSDRGGMRQIHLMDPGGESTLLLPGQPAGENYFPVWHPDGRRILITSNEGESYSLFALDLQHGETTLLSGDVSSGPGSWSFEHGEVLYSAVVGEGSEIRSWSVANEDRRLIDCQAVRLGELTGGAR